MNIIPQPPVYPHTPPFQVPLVEADFGGRKPPVSEKAELLLPYIPFVAGVGFLWAGSPCSGVWYQISRTGHCNCEGGVNGRPCYHAVAILNEHGWDNGAGCTKREAMQAAFERFGVPFSFVPATTRRVEWEA